jgi:hypothetical protein
MWRLDQEDMAVVLVNHPKAMTGVQRRNRIPLEVFQPRFELPLIRLIERVG